MISESTIPPTTILMIAPMGSASSDSLISGVKVTVTVGVEVTVTVGVTDMVTVGLVNSLDGVTIGSTISKKLHHYCDFKECS